MPGAELPLDAVSIAIVVLGAVIAGFTTGVAGFGTGLVASGLWFHALPAAMVPPLVVLASVLAQIAGLFGVRRAFNLRAAAPLLAGGLIGVPFGVAALAIAPPTIIRTGVALFLIAYALFQFLASTPRTIGGTGGAPADVIVGAAGGFLGGFAGLSGPVPLIWLQLRGGASDAQRAIYQPFNLLVLGFAAAAMAIAGQLTWQVLTVALICLPATMASAWAGVQVYGRISQSTFRRVVLMLLLLSGTILLAQTLLR
ncbi:MAG: sulfite exporter TauE/SafE family protein [Hyphomicrobiales bacterium]|nr:MAG: sulfite exporter TauE/SafE family protein [Hyphomicrobiales bacterium]